VTLLVDVGNSAVKWAVVAADGRLAGHGRALHRAGADIASALTSAWRALPAFERAVGCSVAGDEVVDAIERVLRSLGVAAVEWLRSQPLLQQGSLVLENGYRDPGQLGADRWHALVGACARLPGESLVVVNAGTATTVDCIRHDAGRARFVGGCIAPGVRLMLESLARGTAGLPLAAGAAADFPDSTDSAIMTGVLDAQAGLVERVRSRFATALGRAPRLLLAGGHAEALAARLSPASPPVIEHNLVLRGLALRALAR
jgi:type III pantothenate kinase